MTKTEFQREERYVVFKVSDLGNSLKGDEIRRLAREYAEQRRLKGKEPLECVVVEKDWPEYEPTWKAIEARVTGAQPAPSFADAYQGAMEEVAIWKKRALEAEDLNRKFVAEINGPTYMGGPAQPAPNAVAYLDLGVGGYMDIGTDLTDEELATLPKGRHMLGIVGTYGVDGYVPAQNTPSVPEGWLRAIDEALVTAHIGVANAEDTYEQAKAKLDSLIGWHTDVATDPAVNGGYRLIPIEPTEDMLRAMTDPFIAINGDNRKAFEIAYTAMLEAAPEAKP